MHDDNEHEHHGTIDIDDRPSSRRCCHRVQDRSSSKEHTAGDNVRMGMNAAASLTGRAAMASIVAEMKYKGFLTYVKY